MKHHGATRASVPVAVVGAALVGAALLVAGPAAASAWDDCATRFAADPGSHDAAACWFEAARTTGELGEGVRRLEELVRELPEEPWPRFYLGSALWSLELCQGRVEEAFREASRLFDLRRDAEAETRSRTNLIWLLVRCGEPEKAFEELERAEEVARASADPLDPLRLGLVRQRLAMDGGGDLELVLPELRNLLAKADRDVYDAAEGIWPVRRECLRTLAQACYDLGKTNETYLLFRERRDRAREAGDLAEEAAAGYDLALERLTYRLPKPGLRQDLAAELTGVLRAAEASSSLEAEALTRTLLAKLEGGPDAVAHLERCRRVAEERGDTKLRHLCRLTLAGQLADTDPEAASDLLAELDAEPLPNDAQAGVDYWDDLLHAAWQSRPRVEALARAEEVVDRIEGLRDPQTGLARSEVLAVGSGAFYWLAGRLLEEAEAGGPGSESLRRAFAVLERLRAQELREILASSGETVPRLEPPPADLLDQVAAALGPGEAMLSYQLSSWQDVFGRFAGGAWVLATTRDGTRVYRLGEDRVAIEPAVETLLDQTDPWSDATLTAFGEDLLAPALADLPAEVDTLILVPDGILHLLPFAALHPEAGGPALGERWAIEVEPSAALWLEWRESAPAVLEPSALVFVDPEVTVADAVPSGARGTALGPLPYARREGRRVVRHLGGRSRLLEGAEASEGFLETADLEPFGLLHFATHAVADVERPWLSGVLLASDGDEDGWLLPEEIAGLDLAGKVVVLSTCDSAGGGWLRGEGVMSLARAFFTAGAHAVVGTLRPLPDELGARFFDDFYAALSTGSSLRDALASTQRAWAAQDLPASTWASVVVLGNGDLVPAPGGVERPFPWTLTLAATGLAAIAVAVLWRRRRRDLRDDDLC